MPPPCSWPIKLRSKPQRPRPSRLERPPWSAVEAAAAVAEVVLAADQACVKVEHDDDTVVVDAPMQLAVVVPEPAYVKVERDDDDNTVVVDTPIQVALAVPEALDTAAQFVAAELAEKWGFVQV
jgi:hypothetical protein